MSLATVAAALGIAAAVSGILRVLARPVALVPVPIRRNGERVRSAR